MLEITKEMDEYKFYFVAEKLYHYAWHELADKILEESKKIFKEGSEIEKKSRKQFLLAHTGQSLARSSSIHAVHNRRNMERYAYAR